MSNTPSADLFKDFEIPAFETGTTVPAQPVGAVGAVNVPNNSANTEFPFMPVIATIAAIMIVALIIKLAKGNKQEVQVEQPIPKKIKKEQKTQQEVETPSGIERQKAVEIKSPNRERKNFATPTNLNKCIRLFLENTRTR